MTTMHGNLTEMELARGPHVPVPLPGEDDLPSSDAVPMETARHRDQMNLLIHSLEQHWSARDDYFVGGNMFIYFSAKQLKKNDFLGPDVFVVLDTERRERKSWVAWQEGGKLPDVVIELLSESTEENERGKKRELYETVWKVGAYVLYDPFSHALEGFERVGGELVPLVPDDRGDLPIREMGLSLGVRHGVMGLFTGPILRWIDRGEIVASPVELARGHEARAEAERERAEAERERAEAERERREAAEQRILELEARLAGR